MSQKFTDIATLWFATSVGDHNHLVACYDDFIKEENAPTVLIDCDGTKPKALANLDWSVKSITHDPNRINSSIVVGMNGEYARFEGGIAYDLGFIHDNVSEAKKRGTILRVQSFGSSVYACGGNYQVYEMDSNYNWHPFEDGLFNSRRGTISQFEFLLQSKSTNTMYLGGAKGEGWIRSSGAWAALDLPTNLRLLSACEDRGGKIWVSGQAGLVMSGSDYKWEILHQDPNIGYLWDITIFNDRVFVSSSNMLYEVIDEELIPIDFSNEEVINGDIPLTFHKLFRNGEYLYSIGAKDWAMFDGKMWEKVHLGK